MSIHYISILKPHAEANRLSNSIFFTSGRWFFRLKIINLIMAFLCLVRHLLIIQEGQIMVWGKEYTCLCIMIKKALFLKQIHITGVNVSIIKRHLQSDSRISARLKNKFYKCMLPHCDSWIAQSKGVQYEMQNEYGVTKDKITVIYPMISTHYFSSGQKAKKSKYLAFIGRLEEEKRPFMMMDIFFGFIKKYKDYKLKIVGDGILRAKLKEFATAKGCIDSVEFLGQLSDPKPVLDSASAIILTSDYEGFGMVLVEAIACGTPAVSMNCPTGPREIIKDGINGYLAQDKQEFLKKLDDTIERNDWDKAQMIESIHSFHPDKVIQEYYDFFRASSN